MGIALHDLNDKQLSMIPENERKPFGKGGRTTSECISKAEVELERKEHSRFSAYLDRNEYAYCHSRTDRRTTTNLGVPDFIIGCRIGLAIEFKRGGGRLSLEQEEWRRRHEARGGVYRVVKSYQEAREILEATPECCHDHAASPPMPAQTRTLPGATLTRNAPTRIPPLFLE